MDIKYNKEKLSEILKNVYELLRTPISIFDKDFQFLTSYPPEGYLTDFCRMVRQSPERLEKCRQSDEKSCALCKQTNRTFSYLCHAGIRETITPIRFEKTIIGYILFGEYRIVGAEKDVRAYAMENEMDAEAMQRAYEKLTVLTEEQVHATCEILQSCILQFWLSEAILLKENEIAERLKTFIDDNLHEGLTAEDLCKNFFLSRQQLYAIFRENFAVPVKQYVLERKIAKAKQLLSTTDLSVTAVAERTGFADYNNFIQRFKKMTGITPLQYRKRKQ
ncbi:MAG: helix-turn-helix domain-containing protein [Clostridiales bacterium]|nr:helix-turn-helix domain-containing protein [Clostridiales bacterium]